MADGAATGAGGYVERPKNEPGTQTLWIGLQRMYDLAWAWNSFGVASEPGLPRATFEPVGAETSIPY